MLLLVDIQCELGGAISAEAVTPNYSALIRCVVGVGGEGWGQGGSFSGLEPEHG